MTVILISVIALIAQEPLLLTLKYLGIALTAQGIIINSIEEGRRDKNG